MYTTVFGESSSLSGSPESAGSGQFRDLLDDDLCSRRTGIEHLLKWPDEGPSQAAVLRPNSRPSQQCQRTDGGDQQYQIPTHAHERTDEVIKLRPGRNSVPAVALPARGGETSRAPAAQTEASDIDGSAESFAMLSRFLTDHNLTAHLAAAEADFQGAGSTTSHEVTTRYGFSDDLLDAALAVRAHVGRLNDVIHATVIARVLPALLEDGEVVVQRPSLGAGNDPSRPFDLETDHRIAEFKVAQWKGADTMRKRGVVADLVHLALDESGRRAQLFVVGALPIRFLTTSKSTIAWALARSSPHTRARFEQRFGPATDFTIADFTRVHGRHIELVDLATLVPSLALPPELI
ncbi:hypothetical protein [Nocardia sp. NPDC057272]|uniref:hypothetical protein n=1 Tax=Nocardia sp. NPDC057272 TaxID=3346079 RepID=UPI00362C69F7